MSDSQSHTQLDPDDRAHLEMLVEKMFTSPAIQCDIRYVWTGNQELADRAGIFVRMQAQTLKEKYPWMLFDDLRAIYFYGDYEQGLRDATDPGNAVPEPTKEAGGFAVGMHVQVADGCKLVMHEGVAHALLSDDPERNDFAVSVLRHELCHVHDEAFKRMLAARDAVQYARSAFEGRFLRMSQKLWSEYFANKYSHGEWSSETDDFDLLSSAVPAVRGDVHRAIRQYRTSHDLNALLALAESKAAFLTQCMGYAAGRLAGLEKSLDEHAPELANMLDAEGLLPVWDLATATLAELDAKQPAEWPNVWEIIKLNAVGAQVMSWLGMHYRPNGDGIYVDIPETPETVPTDLPYTSMAQLIRGLDLTLAKRMHDLVASITVDSHDGQKNSKNN